MCDIQGKMVGGLSQIRKDLQTGIDLDEMGLGNVQAFLQYKTPKMIRVDVPHVGAIYRVAQVLIVFYVVYTMLANNQWAESEITIGSFNAWSERGGVPTSVTRLDAPYCSNPSYSYSYAPDSRMDDPVCVLQQPTELTTKGEASVFLVTMFQEVRLLGWPCADQASGKLAAEDKVAACNAMGAAIAPAAINSTMPRDGQCTCVTERTVFPFAPERMNIAFEHAFYVDEHGWPHEGNSNVKNAEGTKDRDRVDSEQ